MSFGEFSTVVYRTWYFEATEFRVCQIFSKDRFSVQALYMKIRLFSFAFEHSNTLSENLEKSYSLKKYFSNKKLRLCKEQAMYSITREKF